MSLTGDFAALDRLMRGVADLGAARFRETVLRRAAPMLSGLVRGGFDRSTAPRGTEWRPLKQARARGRANKGGPLVASGELREQAGNVVVIGEGLLIFVRHPGALTHLYGSKGRGAGGRDARGRFTSAGRIPARPYLPLRSLPAPWARSLATVATSTFRDTILG